MPAQAKRDLFLSVSGDITPFEAAMKSGRSVLAQFGASAEATADEVKKAFDKFVGGDLNARAEAMAASYEESFRKIRSAAKKVTDAPTNLAAFDILSAENTRQAVANAENRVAALRAVEAAAHQAANASGSAPAREYALGASAAVQDAEAQLAARRAQLGVLQAVEEQMKGLGLTTREQAAADEAAAMRRQEIAIEEAAAQAKLVDRSEALIRSIDPLYAAEARFAEAIGEANALREAGVLVEERYAEAVAAAEAARDKVTGAAERAAEAKRVADLEAEAAATAALADRAEQLYRSVNPLYAAQARYQETLKLTAELEESGALVAERAAQVRTDAMAKLNAVNDAGVRAANAEQEAQALREASFAFQMFETRAREGAQAMREAEAEEQRLTASAEQLTRAANPLYAALKRYGETLVLVTELETAGYLSQERATQIRANARSEMSETNEALMRGESGHRRFSIAGMEAEHVMRAFSDSIAAGQSPVKAFAMELPRVSEALMFWSQTTEQTEGKLGKLAAFMGGGWGIAISAGLAVLGPLIAELFKTGEESETAKKALQEYASYMDDLGNFVDRATGKIIEQNRALAEGARLRKEGEAHTAAQETGRLRDAAFDTVRQASKTTLATTSGTTVETIDPALAKVLEHATGKAALQKLVDGLAALAKANPAGYENLYRRVLDQASRARKSYGDYKDDRGQAGEITTVLGGGTVLTKESIDDRVAQKNATDALSKAEAHLTAVRHEGEIANNRPAGAERDAALARYEKDLNAAIAAVNRLKEARKSASANREVGRDPSFDEVKQIIEGLGGHVTSTERTREQQQMLYDRYMAYKEGKGPWAPLAAKPGSSLHEAGNGVAVDFTGVSLGAARKALADRGIRVSEALNEGDHEHIGIRKRGGVGPSDETLANRAQAAADKATRDAEAYTQLSDRGSEELLRLQRQQVFNVREAADLDVEQVQVERDRANAVAQAGVAERKWTQAQADALIATNRGVAALKIVAIQREEQQKLLDQQLTADRAGIERGMRLIELQSSLADTTGQRHALALRLLALEEDQARLAANRKLASNDPIVQQQGRDELKQVDAEHGYRVQQIDRQDADPLTRYKHELNANVGDMNDALKGVEADGLKGLSDGLVGILNGTKSVAAGFRDMAMSVIADLEKIAVEKLILSFLGLKGGGKVDGFATGGLPGYADGGNPSVENNIIRGPGTGISDSIMALVGGRKLIKVSNGEGIVNERGVRKYWPIVDAINEDRLQLPAFADGGLVDPGSIYMRALPDSASIARVAPPPQVIYVQVDKADLFDVHVQRAAAPLAQAAMIGGAQQAKQDLAEQGLARIPT